MIKSTEMANLLIDNSEYQKLLFTKGYIITNMEYPDLSGYPFYKNWVRIKFGNYKNDESVTIYHHKKETSYSYQKDGVYISIIGHAYNPFNMMHDENEILKDCLDAYFNSKESFYEKISELTGIHLIIINDNGVLLAFQDCGGMKSCYYGHVNDKFYITSHPQLIGDLTEIIMDPAIVKLMEKKFFSIGGRYLPGDLSPYKELKRLGPNTFIEVQEYFLMKRFYPSKPHREILSIEYENTIEKLVTLIKNNIELCKLKWERPAISLTGGMDSKTTLACVNGNYNNFHFYSFHSKPQELEDAIAAHTICEGIGVKHNIYSIPEKNHEIEGFSLLKKIILHNSSYIGNPRDHEIRKFIYLSQLDEFDVELKSWISEVGRAMWGKKYRIKLPAKLSPRHFSIFQSRYICSPKLLSHADKNYKSYLKRIDLEKPIHNYEHADMFYWEFRFGSWGSNVVTTQDVFNHTVTIPLNNRKMIEMFLWFPHDFRKDDVVNKEIIRLANEEIYYMNVNVHNMYLRSNRVLMEKVYYYYRILPYGFKEKLSELKFHKKQK